MIWIMPIMMIIGLGIWLIFHSPGQPRIKYVFLITIDTLRADHLGCYGYPRNTSPFIDSLAHKGILFEKAISQSASTGPSHASIFTGLYPSQHRLVGNGYMLDDTVTTLAEIIQKNNINTAAFTSTDSHFFCSNLHRGFTFYDEPKNARLTYNVRYRPAAQTIDHAALWLANFNLSQDLFLWIHLFDPHRPYRKHKSIYKELDGIEKRTSFKKYLNNLPINLKIFNGDLRIAHEWITNYDAEIRYVDEELRRLFRLVDAKGMLKDSFWIITSDHGESLGQHNWLDHGRVLYQEDIHVPLIFFNGGEERSGPRRIDKTVENFDIFPTLLDLLRVIPDKKVKQAMQAVSLLPQILSDRNDPIEKCAFSERTHFITRMSYGPDIPFWKQDWEDGEKYAIQDQRWKYVHHTLFEDELYDLETDPWELNNLISRKHDIPAHARLFDETMKLMKQLDGSRNKKTRLVDKKTIKTLRSLGYI